MQVLEVCGAGLGSCSVLGFSIGGTQPSDPAATLLMWLLLIWNLQSFWSCDLFMLVRLLSVWMGWCVVHYQCFLGTCCFHFQSSVKQWCIWSYFHSVTSQKTLIFIVTIVRLMSLFSVSSLWYHMKTSTMDHWRNLGIQMLKFSCMVCNILLFHLSVYFLDSIKCVCLVLSWYLLC